KLQVLGDEAGIPFRPSLGQRRFDVFWRDGSGIRWLGLGVDDAAAPMTPQTVFALPAADPARIASCHAGATDWFLLDGNIARAATGTPVAAVDHGDRGAEVLACDAEHLVVVEPDRSEIDVCAPAGCKNALLARPGPGSSLLAAWGAAGGLLAATTSGDLVLVWRGPVLTVWRMPDAGRQLRALVEWTGAVHLLFEVPERGLELVRLP
ncbi:MAG TPA: hypothetical protein VL172_03310, partial [Kofleriaceae bacterium]|nr:hypothetical protein [Kofleriaceae bacterium]